MQEVVIGMMGAGFASHLHGNALKQVGGISFRLKNIADVNLECARQTAEAYHYEHYTANYQELLADPEIQVVIICTPPVLHTKLIVESLDAGKHVICEKPLTGYFGEEGDLQPIGEHVDRRYMRKRVLESLEQIRQAIQRSGKQLFYAENFIYSPSVQKAAEIVAKKKETITFMKGECSVSRSPSKNAGNWSNMGGGSLLRIGCHPLGAILYLKQVEAKAKGTSISVASVSADLGKIASHLSGRERKYITGNPIDVEDLAMLSLTFSDNTKAFVLSNDNVLGGLVNYVNVYTTEGTMLCNTVPRNIMKTYFVSNEGLDDIYISENLDCKTGWNDVFISESIERGYVNQLKDFMECILTQREPTASYEIAFQTIETIYDAYVSAQENCTVKK